MNITKQIAQVVEEAAARGWSVATTKTGRYMLRHPSGGSVVVWASGDPHGLKNARAAIRRVEERSTTP